MESEVSSENAFLILKGMNEILNTLFGKSPSFILKIYTSLKSKFLDSNTPIICKPDNGSPENGILVIFKI